MIRFQELLEQLELRPSPEALRSLEVGIHLSSIQGPPGAEDLASRALGWHMDRLTAALAHGAAEAFFDEFGRYCGRLVLASLDDDHEERFLEGEVPGAEMMTRPLGTEAWIIEAGFWYGALYKGHRALQQAMAARGIETIGYVVHRASAPPIAKVVSREGRASAEAPPREAPPLLARLPMAQLRHEARAWLAERQAIGAAMRVLSSSERFRALSLHDAMCLLLGPISLGQYQLEHDTNGRPVRVRSWAYLTDDATARLTTQGPRSLSDGCWNQGSQKTLVFDRAIGATSPAASEPGWAWAVLPESRYSILDHHQPNGESR